MDGYTYTRTQRDCGIVAVSNLTGISYNEVFHAAKLTGYLFSLDGTTDTYKLPDVMAYLGYACIDMPKNLSAHAKVNFTGFYQYRYKSKNEGHIVACMDGMIFDYDGTIRPIRGKGRLPYVEKFFMVMKKG